MTVILGGGGGGNTPFPTMVFQTSRTWACPMAMEAMVFVIGAGGGGGGGVGTASGSSSGAYNAVQGGGGGGCSVSKLTLVAQNYTIVVGARGDRGVRSGSGGSTAGTAGGNSTFAGSGITTMAGNGGGAGIVSGAYGGSIGAVSGGTATGGTIANNTGGGNAALNTERYAFSSGGGVGIWEAGEDGLANPNTVNVVLQGGGPFRNRALGMTGIPSSEGGTSTNSTLTGDIFNGVQQMVRDQQGNNSGTYRYTNSVNYTGRPVALYAPTNATQYRYLSGSSPFTGGAGNSNSAGTYYNYASPGVAGGGGGGANNINSLASYGGAGGNGVIIIMPLTVGS